MIRRTEHLHLEARILFRAAEGRIVSWSPAMERRYGIPCRATGRSARMRRNFWDGFPASIVDINQDFLAHGMWRGGILTRHGNGAPLLTASEWHQHRCVARAFGFVAEIHADPAGPLRNGDGRLSRDLLTVLPTFTLEAFSASGLYLAAARRVLESADALDLAILPPSSMGWAMNASAARPVSPCCGNSPAKWAPQRARAVACSATIRVRRFSG